MKVFQASILFSAVLFCACQSKSYKISGTVERLSNGDTLFVTHDLESGFPSDTVIVSDGKFSLSGETDSTSLCMIYSAKRNELNAPFFLEPGDISIKLKNEPGGSRVAGTHCNDQWQRLNDSVMVIGKEINRIAEHIYGNNLPQEEQQKGMEQIDKLNQRFAKLVVKTAEDNTDNEFGYFLLTYYPEELIDNDARARLIKEMPKEFRQRPAIKEIEKTLAVAAKTAEGATISDFRQPSIDGGELSIMDEVKKNKITIIRLLGFMVRPLPSGDAVDDKALRRLFQARSRHCGHLARYRPRRMAVCHHPTRYHLASDERPQGLGECCSAAVQHHQHPPHHRTRQQRQDTGSRTSR